jgi:hypothetical protein
MLAHTLILLPAAGLVIPAIGILIRNRREREDKLSREVFKNVRKLQDELNCRRPAND